MIIALAHNHLTGICRRQIHEKLNSIENLHLRPLVRQSVGMK